MSSNSKIALVAFVVFFLSGFFMMSYLESALNGTTMTLGIDLYPRWIGSQAVLNGQSPYSQETRQQIWQAIYGSSKTPDGNPFGFYYPPSITTVLFPFILSGLSLKSAAVLWSTLLWAAWAGFLILAITFVPDNPVKKWLIPLLFVSGLVFRPAFSNYLLGQYSLLSVLMLIGAYYSFKNNYWVLAGIFCSFALIKFSLTVIPVLLLFAIYWRSWKSIISFVVTNLILYLPPTFMLGWWIPDFLKDISNYIVENEVAWSWRNIFTIPGLVWLISSLYLLVFSLSVKDIGLMLASGLALNAIFVPHTADYDLVVFILLLGWLMFDWLRKPKISKWSVVLLTLLIWFPWISLIIFIQGGGYKPVDAWYRFIWMTYPALLLLISGINALKIKQSMVSGSDQKLIHF